MLFMPALQSQPWLALAPALVLWMLALWRGPRWIGRVALAWALYALYEFSMLQRWMCTGECNIRIDLLLLHPLLQFATLLALLASWRRPTRRSPGSAIT